MSGMQSDQQSGGLPKWLPWVIGIVVLALLFSWMRGCGKAPMAGAAADSTPSMAAPPAMPSADTTMQAMPAPDTTTKMAAPAAAPAPAPADNHVTPSPAPSGAAIGAHGDTTHHNGATLGAPEPMAAPTDTGHGAMGGRGAPGKKKPAAP
jgi:hypothetical protein